MRYPFVFLFVVVGLLQGCAVPVVAAGVGAGAMMSADRRSTGTMVEDDTIESKAQKRIDDKYKDASHVSVTAFNRFALITGTAADENAKMDIERIVGSIPNVKGIANELSTGQASGLAKHGDDSRITGNVKLRFVKSTAFKADHVKVVTENGVVYLMGLVTRAEADAASDIASTTANVAKVVRVFEYID
ncbi:MAG: BON domain-containing protein [Nitrosomonadales bacterium]|nr:BON domain-containing protein [Nitrosomonadales bacterium]